MKDYRFIFNNNKSVITILSGTGVIILHVVKGLISKLQYVCVLKALLLVHIGYFTLCL